MLLILALFSLAAGGLLAFLTSDAFGYWPSAAFFALAVFGAGLIHRGDSRRLTALLKPVAQMFQGRLRRGTLLSYPGLSFVKAGQRYDLTFLPNGGQGGSTGPFTALRVTLTFNTAQRAALKRSNALLGAVVDSVAPNLRTKTGAREFDEAYRLDGPDRAILAGLLTDDLRTRLLASDLPALALRIENETIAIHMDGLPASRDQVEEMIALAGAVSERCAATHR